ncbi:MAG: twin-arginine translocase subunit TatC [Gemmatimonadetes bacterium]|nr:twin-arginine translocase subunit TatC [Gemmatimonadota bacterium]
MRRVSARAEMPFLEHLEELRWRLLWSLLAVVIGTALGFWAVQYFDVLGLLKQPIAPYLPQGRLYITHPVDAFVITLKLAVLVGLVVASPVIVWQAWAFFSPALYEREKRYLIPVLGSGIVLFLCGAVLAYHWVLPAAFRILLAFQSGDLEPIITVDAYFSFAAQLILAFGVSFELPLVLMLLGAFGIVTPAFLAKNRRYWVVIAAVGAALLTPTPDAMTMILMMAPLVLLYEVGIVLARLVSRRKDKGGADQGKGESGGNGGSGGVGEGSSTAAALLLLLLAGPMSPARAQEGGKPPLRPPAADSLGGRRPAAPAGPAAAAGQSVDTAAGRLMGLPTTPSRSLPPADSAMRELLQRKGYRMTRFGADSLTFHAPSRQIDLTGSALVERDGSTLEADSVRFLQNECRIAAEGEPTLFDQGTVLVGEGMRYDTCTRRGIVADALTKFNQSGVAWFLRGHLAIDSASTRIYAGGSRITSSDLPLPDYHFSANRVKWVSNTIMVARPAVLYVRDVPVLWLPFIFQDMRRGRRSGILVPRFGINDIVRPNRGYRRHISNVGYYVAINDYLDAQAALDWFAGTSVSVNGQLQYRWLNRFVTGAVSVTRMQQTGEGDGGQRSLHLQWTHQQSFNLRTRFSANVDYATSSQILRRNTIDPYLETASLRSTANFNKQFGWGALSIGGSRAQELSSGVVTQSLPNLSLQPAPINLSNSVTWSPSFSFSNDQTSHQFAGMLVGPPVDGVPTSDSLFATTRNSRLQLGTPLRIGRWNLPLDVSATHAFSDRRSAVILPDPDDTTRTLTRYYGEDFSTTVDWNTQIGLPTLFSGTWRLQPSVGMQNSTGGPFFLRNRFTGGDFVSQGKRFSFAVGVSPTLFGFFPGVGPLQRIRHSLSPSLRWSYAPPANVPEAYARAIDPSKRQPLVRSPRLNTMSFGLSQTVEGKFRQAPEDTTGGREARKIKLLSLQTSALDYDFEQAKQPGKSGWRTASISNQFTSDLLPGFSLSTSHDLWRGPVGDDTTRFSPFLTQVSARFSVSGSTLRGLAALLTGRTLGPPGPGARPDSTGLPVPGGPLGGPFARVPGSLDRLPTTNAPAGRRPLTTAITFNDQRVRFPSDSAAAAARPEQRGNRTMGLNVAFSPSPGWTVSWDTQYNFTTKEFGQHLLKLDRDLRRWHATFAFVKAPNGNFAFDFFITLLDQPDIKFQYDQRTVRR